MPKEVRMSIKMESALREQFMAIAATHHRPAAQIIRDLMRLYIADSESPNALTAETLRKAIVVKMCFTRPTPRDCSSNWAFEANAELLRSIQTRREARREGWQGNEKTPQLHRVAATGQTSTARAGRSSIERRLEAKT